MKSISLANIVLTANHASAGLAARIARELAVPYTAMQKDRFADGEISHVFPVDIAARDLIIVGATPDDAALQELIDLIDGAWFWNARSINVVIPFLGYSTMERAKPGSGEIPKGVTRTRQIFRSRPDFVFFIDLHSEAVLHAHGGNISTFHIQTDSLFVEHIKKLGLSDYVLVSPDYGRSKWVAGMASRLGCPHTAADKDRFARDQTMVHQVSSVVRNRTVIIFDDMIRTGGSILQTAERCLEVGAGKVMVMATHLVLCNKARKRFAASGIDKVVGTDTYPGIRQDAQVRTISVAPLVASVLTRKLKIG
jgi:ribose-phosphate pyrophosphokinase